MDRLVWLTWRAFWVGLGACAVLVVQTATQPASAPRQPSAELAPAPPPVPRLAKPGV